MALQDLKNCQALLSDKINENEGTGACGTYEGKQRTHLKDPDVNWRVILKRLLKKQGGVDMDSIHQAQDMGKWEALVNRVMDFWIP